jgi:hypothetical protein
VNGRTPILVPTLLRVAILAGILAPAPAFAQLRSPTAAGVPSETIKRIINQEVAFCQSTDTATAAQLTGIEADIQRAMTAAQQKVDKLIADSTALAQPVTNAKTKYDQLETRVGQLQVARNAAKASLDPLDAKIAAAEGAASGGPSRHEQLMAEETSLRQRIQLLREEVKKANKAMEGLNVLEAATANEGPIADLRKAEQDLATVMEELRGIRRQTIPIRYGAEYVALKAKWEKADADATSAEVDRDNAKKELDAAELEMSKFDGAALELARDENLYAYEHLYRAKQCVDKRREELAKPAGATPVAPPQAAAAGASGKWGVTCKWNDPQMSATNDGGTFSITITPSGAVSGTYVSDSASYPVTGQLTADGSASGQGTGSSWSVTWSGTLQRTASGATGSGSISVTISDFGGGTCSGGWSIP